LALLGHLLASKVDVDSVLECDDDLRSPNEVIDAARGRWHAEKGRARNRNRDLLFDFLGGLSRVEGDDHHLELVTSGSFDLQLAERINADESKRERDGERRDPALNGENR